MNPKHRVAGLWALLFCLFLAQPASAALKTLHGHVPAAVSKLAAIGLPPATNQLHLAIGVVPRDLPGLQAFAAAVSDPASPQYRQYLTPEEITARFGPTAADYEAVKEFARSNGLTITATTGNRLLLDVSGNVSTIEKAFHITLKTYHHPSEARNFFAPDTEPTVDARLPVVDVSGLSDFSLPHPHVHKMDAAAQGQTVVPKAGSGPSGYFLGTDFRNAYVPGVALNGTGQMVGQVQFDAFYPIDVTNYENLVAGTPRVPVQAVLIDSFDGNPTSNGNIETSLDIEMAISMAPKLAGIVEFEGNPNTGFFNPNDVLNTMASSNTIKNLSSSWGWSGGPQSSTETIFITMAAEGQTYFNATGDGDAFTPGQVDNPSFTGSPSSSPNIVQVGGTLLTMNGSGVSYANESVWNRNNGTGSSGGISTTYGIPGYQQSVNVVAPGGSATQRNIPDVALTAENVYVAYNSGGNAAVGGTSCAAPLWAGFMSLVNQQAAASGKPAPGFINPTLYELAAESIYNSVFHDTTSGNNTSTASPNAFYAAVGYDLCTGLGTPNGINMINNLVSPDPFMVITNHGFNATGPVSGPFAPASETFMLTNSGAGSVTWSIINTSSVFTVTSTSGVLAGGTGTAVTVGLNNLVSNLPAGFYPGTIWFSNVTSGVAHSRQFNVTISSSIAQNGGFETGDFTGWSNGGAANIVDNGSVSGISPHTGSFLAALRQNGSVGNLSQTLTTVPGQAYFLSLWVNNPVSGANLRGHRNQFTVTWNGTTVFTQTNVAAYGWTNIFFLVNASTTSTTLNIGVRDDPSTAYFGVDDVSVVPGLPPAINAQPTPTNALVFSGGNITFTASATGGTNTSYRWQKNSVNLADGAGISGSGTASLALTAVTTGSSGNYTVVAANNFGSVTSSVATLLVVVPPSIASGNLTNRTVQCGSSNVTYSVTAAGTAPLSYQWSLDGSPVNNATNTTLILASVHMPNHTVSLAVTNPYAGLTSNTVLTVVDTQAPVITLNGAALMTNELGSPFIDPGATALDACVGPVPVTTNGVVNTSVIGTNLLVYKATDGNGNTNSSTRTVIIHDTTPPTITWSFTNLVMGTTTNCGTVLTNLTGTNFIMATDLSGAVTVAQAPTNGAFLSLGTNALVYAVSDSSGNVAHSTNTIVVVDKTPPVIVTQPQSTTNGIGGTANFTIAATACTPLSFLWYSNSIALTVQTNLTLSISNLTASAAVNYFAVATSTGGSVTSAPASLVIAVSPSIASGNLTNRSVECGLSNITYSVAVSGTPPLSLQWSLDGTPLTGATNTSLTLTNIHMPNHTVSLAVTNPYTGLTSNTVLTVVDTQAPVITLNGAALMTNELGSPFIDPGATALDACAGPVPVTTNGVVNTGVIGTNLMVYKATDGNGNTNSATRTVIVHDTTPPTITWSFTNLVLGTTTNCGVVLTNLTGTNFIQATDLSGAVLVAQSPTNGAFLSLGTNALVYAVSDSSGNVAYSTNTIVVVDQTPPAIVLQPQSRTNVIGSTAGFTVGATACSPLNYLWYSNTIPLAAQTNTSLLLTGINPGFAGNYFAVATSTGGSATSQVAALVVSATPVFGGESANGNGTFSLNLLGLPGYTYILQANTNLTSPNGWQPIATNTLGANGVWNFTDSNAVNFLFQYYRLMLSH